MYSELLVNQVTNVIYVVMVLTNGNSTLTLTKYVPLFSYNSMITLLVYAGIRCLDIFRAYNIAATFMSCAEKRLIFRSNMVPLITLFISSIMLFNNIPTKNHINILWKYVYKSTFHK